jgi:GNAT superfamily N-acetyltransferase
MARFVYTRARDADAEELTATAVAGLETYRSFAPSEWNPPHEATAVSATRSKLGNPDTWGLLARTADGEPVGHVAFASAMTSMWPGAVDGLGHLWQLFVREPYWGTGVATKLLERAVAEAAGQGYTAMRLFTPEGQGRARRFYEREGWVVVGPPVSDTGFGIPLVEYRRGLG